MTILKSKTAQAPSPNPVAEPVEGVVRDRFIRGLYNLRPEHRGSVVTIGAFDGVHLGHNAIIEQVVAKAAQLKLPSVAMVFEPLPSEYFGQEQAPARLMRLREKLQALFAAGIDRVLCLRFNAKLAALTADQFVQTVLIDGLGVQHLVVGDDFRFGCDRRGDFELLKRCGERGNFSVADTATFVIDGERASSTRVREALAANDFTLAARLLGHPYRITGRVGYGQQLGRTIGVPTANVHLKRHRSPLTGVFAVNVTLSSGHCLRGVANVGVRPTVDGVSKPLLEVHIFEFNDNLYGQSIAVSFVKKLRNEQKFESLAQLKTQIQADIDAAKDYFKSIEK